MKQNKYNKIMNSYIEQECRRLRILTLYIKYLKSQGIKN